MHRVTLLKGVFECISDQTELTMSLQRALRSITRPLAHAYSLSRPSLLSQHSPGRFPPTSGLGLESSSILARFCSTSTFLSADFSRLTESRFPKRRPGFKNRKKRASLRPPGFLLFYFCPYLLFLIYHADV